MVPIVLAFFIGLVVLLSIDWNTSPPTLNPMVLLFGVLVAGVIWIARHFVGAPRACAACGRPVLAPRDAAFCPYCGARLS